MDPSTAATDGTRTGSSPSLAKRTGKILAVRVQMLDETITLFQIQAKALGSVLFEQVCQQVNLLEADYFGLEYAGTDKAKYWLDMEKPMNRQLELSTSDPLLRFAVKFYPPDPAQLEEEFTRYLFCMQIKQDLAHGVLQCNDNTAALIASYLVQAECGDYVAEDYPDHTYLSSYKFIPQQDAELERRIMENHKKHVGQSPAEADLNLLETSRRCELYGIKMHPAKDPEGVPLNLAVAHMGVMVFQNFAKINTFSWAKVRKLSFKRKKFLIKLHPEAHGNYKDVVEFHFEGRDECKNFWKKCVEHHGFFRCTSAKNEPRPKPGVLSRGSSFRYTGRTQKEIVEFVRENYVKRQSFQRSQSFRHASPQNTSASGVGNSLSVHPLLPVGDNVIVASDTVSCGSMVLPPSDSRARSTSTTERAEKVDVHHYSEEPQSPYQHREMDSRLDVESPSTSNNSAASPSSSHRPVYHQYQQQPQSSASPGVFNSLPRSGAQPSSSLPAGQTSFESPCLSSSSCCSPDLSSRPDRDSPVLSNIQATPCPVGAEAPEEYSRHSQQSKSVSREEDSLCSSEYTEPNTYPTTQVPARDYEEAPVSRDSYELLSDSADALFVSAERMNREDDVSYILHRRVKSTMAASKSCEMVIASGDGGVGIDDLHHHQTSETSSFLFDSVEMSVQRSRSFRSLREKTYRERPALYARARCLMEIDIDLNVIDPPLAASSKTSLARPKSIEFVSFQHLPPPDAFSCRDDTVDVSVASSSGSSPTSFAASSRDVPPIHAPPIDVDFVPSDSIPALSFEQSFPVGVDNHKVSDEARNQIKVANIETDVPSEPKEVHKKKVSSEEEEEEEDDDDKMCSLSHDEEEQRREDVVEEEEEQVADMEEFTVTSSVSVDAPLEEDEASASSHQPHTDEDDDEAFTADDVQDVGRDICQDTLSSTSDLEEQLVSDEHLFEFVNDDDGLPDPDSQLDEQEIGIYDVSNQQQQQEDTEFVFEAHVLSRISERSSDSRLSLEVEDMEDGVDEAVAGRRPLKQDDTMSDVSSSFKGSDIAGRPEDEPQPVAALTLPLPPSTLPVNNVEEATPVNEVVTLVPTPHQVMMDEFPSPPSSIDNLPDDECYSDSSF